MIVSQLLTTGIGFRYAHNPSQGRCTFYRLLLLLLLSQRTRFESLQGVLGIRLWHVGMFVCRKEKTLSDSSRGKYIQSQCTERKERWTFRHRETVESLYSAVFKVKFWLVLWWWHITISSFQNKKHEDVLLFCFKQTLKTQTIEYHLSLHIERKLGWIVYFKVLQWYMSKGLKETMQQGVHLDPVSVMDPVTNMT